MGTASFDILVDDNFTTKEDARIAFNAKSIDELESSPMSKGEAFSSLDATFDTALDNDWLKSFSSFCSKYWPQVTYSVIRGTTVTAYSKINDHVTCCKEVLEAYKDYQTKPF